MELMAYFPAPTATTSELEKLKEENAKLKRTNGDLECNLKKARTRADEVVKIHNSCTQRANADASRCGELEELNTELQKEIKKLQKEIKKKKLQKESKKRD